MVCQTATQATNPLGSLPINTLLPKFAIPSIVAYLVTSLYNIVDQIFIGQGVGYLGNAATNVSYPLTTICLAIALLIGIGSASRYSLYLGADQKDRAASIVGNGISMMMICGILYAILIEIFQHPLLTAFGATEEIMPYALDYTRITAVGMPFLIITNGISNLARADGSPKYSMTCMLVGAIINTILDPIFIFIFHMGVTGAAIATVTGQFFSCLMALRYIPKFQQVKLKKSHFGVHISQWGANVTLGLSSSLNQLAITLVQVVLNNSLTYYGAMSAYGKDIPLAACGIVMKTNSLLLAVIIGISQGLQPIIGFNYGAKKYARVRKAYRLAIICDLLISAVGFCMFQFFSPADYLRLRLRRQCLHGVCCAIHAHFPLYDSPKRGPDDLLQFLCGNRKAPERHGSFFDQTGALFDSPAFDSSAFLGSGRDSFCRTCSRFLCFCCNHTADYERDETYEKNCHPKPKETYF